MKERGGINVADAIIGQFPPAPAPNAHMSYSNRDPSLHVLLEASLYVKRKAGNIAIPFRIIIFHLMVYLCSFPVYPELETRNSIFLPSVCPSQV